MDVTLYDYGLDTRKKKDKDTIDREFNINISKLHRAYKFYEECRSACAGQAYDDSAGMARVDSSERDSLADSYLSAVESVKAIIENLSASELEKFLSKHDFGRRMKSELGFIHQ